MLRSLQLRMGLALALGILANVNHVRAVDIYDSITGETDFSSVTTISNNSEKLAQEFTASATYPTINAVSMYLSRDASATGTFDVSIYSRNAGTGDPDTKVSSVATGYAVSTLSAQPTKVDFSGFSFTPGDTNNYFIVLENFAGSFSIGWSSRADGASPMPGLLPADYDGSSWTQGTDDIAYLMTVSAVAVPEPSTWAMLSIGTAIICGVAQRRRLNDEINQS